MADTATVVIGVVQLLLTLIGILIGWMVKGLFDRIRKLEEADAAIASQVAQLRVDLPTHYVSKGDFQQLAESLFNTLRRIEDKLDRKVDKP